MQIEAISRKFYSRLWLIRHLVSSGVPSLGALVLYKSMLRPLLEYAAPAFHYMLTEAQKRSLEQLQARALKIIFWWNRSYRAILNSTGCPWAEARREDLVNKFTIKVSKTDRFKKWFPLNHSIKYSTRKREKYYIPTGRTARYQKGPLYNMRKYLNSFES